MPKGKRRRRRNRLRFETLESRRLLATITVTSAADNFDVDGQVTLREAILAAETNATVDGSNAGDPGADTIRFDAALNGQTIRLTGGDLIVSESLTFAGNGADRTIISGENAARIFHLFGSILGEVNRYELSGLTLENGKAVKANSAAQDEFGGAVLFNGGREEALVIRGVLIQNSEADVGGGVHVNGAKLHVDGSTITTSQAVFGGGLSVQNVRAVLTNSTIHANVATTSSGGIAHLGYDPANPSTVDLINVTLTENESPFARNLRNSSTTDADAFVQFGNSIIFGGVGARSFSNDVTGIGTATTTSLGGNLVEFGIDSEPHLTDRRLPLGEAGILALSASGGTTPTQPLHPLSFAVDGGDNALAFGPGPDLLWGNADDVPFEADQRSDGFARIIDGGSGNATIDVGAFEVQQELVAPSTLVVRNANDALFGSTNVDVDNLSLREAVLIANLQNAHNVVTFATNLNGQQITLDGHSIYVRESIEIIGLGANQLTVSGDNQSRIFTFGNDDGLGGETFVLSGLTITEGSAFNGGGVWLGNNELIIRDTYFLNNRATNGGGFLSHSADVHLMSTTFAGNQAQNGGGAHIGASQGSITNVTFFANVAVENGGGLLARADAVDSISDFAIINSTFQNNDAATGVNVFVKVDEAATRSNVSFGNTVLVSENVDGESSVATDGNPKSTITSLGNNIASQAFLPNPHATDLVNTDPSFEPQLSTDLGAIPTLLPLFFTSPAIEGGNAQLLPSDRFDIDGDGDTDEPLPLDANGNARFVDLPGRPDGLGVDIGAVELPGDFSERFDYGDAPDPSYVTLSENNAPRHRFDSLFLGATIDLESNGQPTANADGDGDDDDGIAFLTSLVAHPTESTTATLVVTASKAGLLDGWIDFSGDGDWLGTAEQIFSSHSVQAGQQLVTFTIPAAAEVTDQTFARFRISTSGGLSSDSGTADDGEIEDYAVAIVDGSSGVTINTLLDANFSFITSGSNLVIAADNEVVFQAPAAVIGALRFVGTDGDDVIRLADLSGQYGDGIPMTVDGLLGTDQLQLFTNFDYLIDSRFTINNVESQLPASADDSTAKLTPAIVNAARGANARLTLVVHNTDAIVSSDLWTYQHSEVLPDGFAKILAVGNIELAVVGGGDWTNPIEKHDVNATGGVTAGDALLIMNQLAVRFYLQDSEGRLRDASSVAEFPNYFFDTTGEGKATALDALRVINFLVDQLNDTTPEAETLITLPTFVGQFTTATHATRDDDKISVETIVSSTEKIVGVNPETTNANATWMTESTERITIIDHASLQLAKTDYVHLATTVDLDES